jgi:hypothetical protein
MPRAKGRIWITGIDVLLAYLRDIPKLLKGISAIWDEDYFICCIDLVAVDESMCTGYEFVLADQKGS